MKRQGKRILIVDAETRSALATCRTLGAAGHFCVTASCHPRSLAGSSRFSKLFLNSPDISRDASFFYIWLKENITKHKIDVVLAMTDASVEGLAVYADELKKIVSFPYVPHSTIEKVQDKLQLLETAREFGIATPKTIPLVLTSQSTTTGTQHHSAILDSLKSLDYPFILKPRNSVQTSESGFRYNPPRKIIRSPKELDAFFSTLHEFPVSYIAQELIEGSGTGVFCLFHNDTSILDFSHKRILEKPPEGGVSVLSESILMDETLLSKVHALLAHYYWEGAAMVEFKTSGEGVPYLMEINPRFWGSLQLAIDAGADFPRILVDPEERKAKVKNTTQQYKIGQRLRWELGTLDHLLILFKRQGLFSVFSLLKDNHLSFFKAHTKAEIFRWYDPKPFFVEIKNYFNRR